VVFEKRGFEWFEGAKPLQPPLIAPMTVILHAPTHFCTPHNFDFTYIYIYIFFRTALVRAFAYLKSC
jgi:hypothetical protein